MSHTRIALPVVVLVGVIGCGNGGQIPIGEGDPKGPPQVGMTGSGGGTSSGVGETSSPGPKGTGQDESHCVPVPEVCGDGIDNNCDGRIDENCGQKQEDDTHGAVLEGNAGRAATLDADAGSDAHSVNATSGDASDQNIGTTSGDASDDAVITTSGDAGDEHVTTVTTDCALAQPRLVAPLSTSRVTLRAPTFKWELASGTDGARVQICTTRDCSVVEQTFDAAGSSGKLPSNLGPGVHYWRALGRSGGSTGCTPSPVWEFFVARRDATLGVDTSWGTMLDVNEDGYADALIGAWQGSSAVTLYLGGPSGLSTTPVFSAAGFEVASAGDVNGDGFGDFVVSTSSGASVFLGGSNGQVGSIDLDLDLGTDSRVSQWPLSGTGAVASAGDVNGDGYGDIVVGRVEGVYSTGTHALVYLGGPTGTSTNFAFALAVTPDGQSSAPIVVANGGDVNGDGYGDIVAGLVSDTRVFVFLGGANGSSASANVLSRPWGMAAGYTGGGDIDGDGYAETLAFDEAGSESAHLYVFRGGPNGPHADPDLTLAYPGSGPGQPKQKVMATASDFDGDGYWDVALSNWNGSIAWVFMGTPTGLSTNIAATFNNPASNGPFGFALSGGDINGDGFSELSIGNHGAQPSGQAFVYPGAASGIGTTPVTVLSCPANANYFAGSIALSASGT